MDSPPSKAPIHRLALWACLALVVVDSIRLLTAGGSERPASLLGLPLDDAWIHLSYARSLAESGVFGYNPGVWENGSTAPLWSVLLAVPQAVGLHPVLAAKVLSILSALLLTTLLWFVAAELGGVRVATLAVVILVLEPWTSVLAVSGMEATAASAAAMGAVLLALRGRWWGCGLALAAAGLLRPELGLLVPAALVVAPGWTERRRALVPPAVAGLAWMGYGILVAGHPLPNAFRTKVGGGLDLLDQLASVGGFFSAGPRQLGALGALLLLGGGGVEVIIHPGHGKEHAGWNDNPEILQKKFPQSYFHTALSL